jgi:hypothetical protein
MFKTKTNKTCPPLITDKQPLQFPHPYQQNLLEMIIHPEMED